MPGKVKSGLEGKVLLLATMGVKRMLYQSYADLPEARRAASSVETKDGWSRERELETVGSGSGSLILHAARCTERRVAGGAMPGSRGHCLSLVFP